MNRGGWEWMREEPQEDFEGGREREKDTHKHCVSLCKEWLDTVLARKDVMMKIIRTTITK